MNDKGTGVNRDARSADTETASSDAISPADEWAFPRLLAFALSRLRLRRIPLPPRPLAAGLGFGDFRKIGFEMSELAIRLGGLERNDRIVDVGCGLGRLAEPLRRFLDLRASYDGIDIVQAYVSWCNAAISVRDPRFRFHHLDVSSGEYNPAGRQDPASATFPFRSGQFTFAIATSLFTHLEADATARYLEETARVLDSRGRLFATFFILDGESAERNDDGQTDLSFAHEIRHGRTTDPVVPEKAIAFEWAWLAAVIEKAGFEIERGPIPGQWRRTSTGPTYQDLVVARKSGV